MESLRLALIHLDIRYQETKANREALMSLIRQSADEGAHIIVTPEMVLSGYSFDSREAIMPFVETISGPTVTAAREIAERHGVFICLCLATRNDRSDIFYNSAIAIDPGGGIVCRYDKINAESRWACPGDPRKDNTFQTPWGRVGILICSDNYYGLMPRVTALRGASLLLAPANWPPSGLDPRELWRARAMENGMYLVACNRTGVDREMDCRKAPSCAFDPTGRTLLDATSATSKILWAALPLTSEGKLSSRRQRQVLNERHPALYHDAYLNLRMINDLTTFLNLPEPGLLQIHGVVPGSETHPVDALVFYKKTLTAQNPHLMVLPHFSYSDAALEHIAAMGQGKRTGVLASRPCHTGLQYFFLAESSIRTWELPLWPLSKEEALPRIDFGPARFMAVPLDALIHPEVSVTAAKRGFDLVVSSGLKLSDEYRLMAGIRTVEGVAIVICAANGAGIWTTPKGHERWGEVVAGPGEICQYGLDTTTTRQKRFQDAIDFQTLLRLW